MVDDLASWSAKLRGDPLSGHGGALRVCELCVQELGVTGGGISMVTSAGNRGIVCATDAVATHLEDLQFTLGEGPCVQAIQTSSPVLIDDLQHERGGQWPAFTESAISNGVGALFAFPLRIGAINVGAMDLYRREPGELSRTELAAALLAADAAATALLELDTAPEGALSVAGDTAGAYDLQVHQATGMVTVQLGISIDEALLILRARAFSSGLSLAQVAREVVQRRLRFTKEDQ